MKSDMRALTSVDEFRAGVGGSRHVATTCDVRGAPWHGVGVLLFVLGDRGWPMTSTEWWHVVALGACLCFFTNKNAPHVLFGDSACLLQLDMVS